MSLLQEFKEFAVKGNAIDMAVGIIIGAAFTKVVNSIVTDLIMPPLGMLIGGVNFQDLAVVLKPAAVGPNGEQIQAVAVRYGAFLNTLVEFLIIAMTIFLVIKFMNRLMSLRLQNLEGLNPLLKKDRE